MKFTATQSERSSDGPRKMKHFTRDSKIADIIKTKNGAEILAKHGVHCPTCPHFLAEAEQLTIGDVCKGYGIDLKKILEALNK